jgi:hypothetical protein
MFRFCNKATGAESRSPNADHRKRLAISARELPKPSAVQFGLE